MARLRKFIATTLATSTFLTGSVFAYSVETNLWEDRRKSVALQPSPTVATLALPVQFLSIRRTLTPFKTKSRGTVLHIQDVHQNLEAQQNISGAVRAIVGKTGPCVVALEGATDVIDLSPFHRFSDQKAVRLVSDWMLRAGKISGPLHALIGFSNSQVVGIDDATHYARNVEAYRRAQRNAAPLKTECDKKQQDWERTQQPQLNPTLMAFNHSLQLFRRGELSYEAYLHTLNTILGPTAAIRYPMANTFLTAARMESTLDFAAVERERAAMQQRQSQDISRFPHLKEYANYLTASYSIESNQLFQETREMEQAAIERLARTKQEKKAMKESRQLYLVSKLLNFSMTRQEWNEYKSKPRGQFFASASVDNFEYFYREAEIRDEKMAENFLKTISGLPSSTNSILVTGGFHSNGMDERLVKAGYTVVQATPKLSKADAVGSEYLTSFLQEKTPLDQLFEGEKLFLSPPQTRNLSMMELADASLAQNPTDELKLASPSTHLVAIRQESIAHGKQVVWRQTKTGVVRILRLFFTSTRVENIQDGTPSTQPQRPVNSIFYNLMIFLGCQPTVPLKIAGLLAVPLEGWLIFLGLNAFSFSVVSQFFFFVGGAGVDLVLSYYGHKWRGVPQPVRPLQFLRTLIIMVMYGLAYSSVPARTGIFLSSTFWNAVALHIFLDAAAFFWEQLIEIGLIHPGLRYDPELYEFFIGGFLYDRPSALITPSSVETTPDAYPHELVLGRLMTDFIPTVAQELGEDPIYILNELEKIQILGVKIPTQLLIAQLFPTRYRQGMIRISRNSPTFYVPLELFGKLQSKAEMRHMAFALIFGVLWRERYEAVQEFTKNETNQALKAKIVHNVMANFERDWNKKEKPFLTWNFQLRHLRNYIGDKWTLFRMDVALHRRFRALKRENAVEEQKIRSYMNEFRQTKSSVIDRDAVAKLFREERDVIIKNIGTYEKLMDEAVAMGEYSMTLPILRWVYYLHVVDDVFLPPQRTIMLCSVLLRNGRHGKELIDLLTSIRDRELEYPILYSAMFSFKYLIKSIKYLRKQGLRPGLANILDRFRRKTLKIKSGEISNSILITRKMHFRENLIRTLSRHAEIVNDDRNRNNIIDVLNTCLRLLDEIEARYAPERSGTIFVTQSFPQDMTPEQPPTTQRPYFLWIIVATVPLLMGVGETEATMVRLFFISVSMLALVFWARAVNKRSIKITGGDRIEPMKEEYYDSVLEIDRATSTDPWDRETLLKHLKQERREDQPWKLGVVAILNKQVVGFMVYETDPMRIRKLGVDPQHRKKGIGRQLVLTLIEQLHPGHKTEIDLWMREYNLVGQLFFRALGFKTTGKFIQRYFKDTGEGGFRMVYQLADYAMLKWLWDLTPEQKQELLEELQTNLGLVIRTGWLCFKAPTPGIRRIISAWPAFAQNHRKVAALANKSIPHLALHSTDDSPPSYDRWLHIETRMIQRAYTRNHLDRHSPARRNERIYILYALIAYLNFIAHVDTTAPYDRRYEDDLYDYIGRVVGEISIMGSRNDIKIQQLLLTYVDTFLRRRTPSQPLNDLGLAHLNNRLLPLHNSPTHSLPSKTAQEQQPMGLIDKRSRLREIVSREA